MARRSRKNYAEVSDIGPIPPVKDPERREKGRHDLVFFLQTYFPHSTGLRPLSDDHVRLIQRRQDAILNGGREVDAVYRGFAKTTISENSHLWAALYGHRGFGLIVGINQQASRDNIDSIKKELSENELLLEDFPEICFPIAELDGKPQRCAAQKTEGAHTLIVWRADRVVLPTVEGAPGSGAIIVARPYSKARGVKHKRADGWNARPDFITIDDPQDDSNSATIEQVRKNLRMLRKGLIPTAGHSANPTVVVNGTVIARDDMMEQLLADPAWQGERVPMVKSWATAHETLWLDEYARIRRAYDKTVAGDAERAKRRANEFYRTHRTEMDAGCVVSWQHCYDEANELSAIQHAYNLLIDQGAEVMECEYQQNPADPEEQNDTPRLTLEGVRAKANGIKRGILPSAAEQLVAKIDVHKEILYWVAMSAWAGMGGHVPDYGTWPKQNRREFEQRKPPIPLTKTYKGQSKEAAIVSGLTHLVDELVQREFTREDGAALRVGKILIDSKWETDLVKEFCRRSPYGAIVVPSMGFYIRPDESWASTFARKPGGQTGWHWRMPPPEKGVRYVLTDTDWLHAFMIDRLNLPIGDRSGWTLFGSPDDHPLFPEHLVIERPEWRKGSVGGKWHFEAPKGKDNHWGDCLRDLAAAAAMLGVLPDGAKPATRVRRIKLSELQRARRG
jgi:hypothetical protein